MSMGGFNLKQPEWSPGTVTFRWSDNPQKITMFLLYNVSCNNCNWDTFSSGPTSPSDPFAIYADPLDALERATDTRIYNSPDLGNFESAEVMVDMRKKTKKVRVARWPKRNNLKQPFRAPKESYFYRFWHLASLITKVVSLKRFVNVSEKAVQVEEMPRTESEKILYKCRKLSVGRQFDMQVRMVARVEFKTWTKTDFLTHLLPMNKAVSWKFKLELNCSSELNLTQLE